VTSRAGRPCAQALATIGRDARQRPEIRARAYEGIPDCQDSPAALVEGARAPEPKVRAAAMRALAQVARSQEGRRLALAALADPQPEVVASAARALGKQGGKDDVDALAPLLSTADPLVREAAAESIGSLGPTPHRALLRRSLLEDESLQVRVAAAHALERVGGPFAASALAEAEAKDPAPYVRHVAEQGLRNLGFRR
jgi:HEAT repeat protein